jgi:amino acid adenylation domain-containing protein
MNKFKNITFFLNELKSNAGAIWLEDERIKFSAPKLFQNQETDDFILKNKEQFITILKENNISSNKKFLNHVIFKDSTQPYYPLSFAQERLWFIEQYEEGTSVYNLSTLYELNEGSDINGIKYALTQVVSRHEILRTTIEQGKDLNNSLQLVHNEPLCIEEIQLTVADDYEAIIREDIRRPFNLNKEYPIRVKIFTILSENSLARNLLLINTHHIASDGWSVEIFQKELFAYYQSYVNKDANFSFPALEIQYKDYALWQRSYLTGKTFEKQLNYWKEKLIGYQTLQLPTDFKRPNQIDYKGAFQGFVLNREISEKLRHLSHQYGATLHSVILSSITILLNKYTGQNDIVVGCLNANRHQMQTESLIGFFVNTQAHRTVLNKNQTFEQLIKQVYQEQVDAQLHQDLPFEKLVDALVDDRDTSRHPLFQVMVGVQSLGTKRKQKGLQENQLKQVLIKKEHETALFDLSIFIHDGNEELTGEIIYSTSLFKDDTITKLKQHYLCLLEQLTQSPDKLYSQLQLLDQSEYNQVIYEWNTTDKAYNLNATIQEQFVAQVHKTPNAIALVYEGEKLTYKQLNEKSNQLAHYIRDQYEERTNQSFKPDTFITLYVDRSLEMVVGILAILKAGGTYVPIDPKFPHERIDYIIGDTNTKIILSQKKFNNDQLIKQHQEKIILIDLTEQLYTKTDRKNLPNYCSANDLAYVIYTSGTTGKPKGVMVEHKAASNTINSMFSVYDSTNVKKATAFTSYVFDVSVSEIFSTLLQGIELHILSEEIKVDGAALANYFINNKINLAYLPPALLSQLQPEIGEDLHTLIYAGEPCDKQTAKLWSSKVKLYNYYGPTEASIYATGKQILTDEVEQIGKPIINTRAYVLSQDKIPVPIGVVGELYIGGSGLARGYLNHPELTAERFLPNPFIIDADNAQGCIKMYKTGDLVRWLPNGNIEYMGRNDDQVKIRGYRIELAEIENNLIKISGIKQACVVAKERTTATGNIKYLVGYYVLSDNEEHLNQEIILEKLSQMLPEYMLPTVLVSMELFPLTINGKLDKRALPDPVFDSSLEEYIPPTTKMEKELCQIWQEVLGLNKVGITDNFFRIGGDSILSIRLVSRIKQIGLTISVRAIFEQRCIQKILQHVEKNNFQEEVNYSRFSLVTEAFKNSVLKENKLTIEQVQDIYPAGYLQAGMLLESVKVSDSDSYHFVESMTISAEFNRFHFEKVWFELIAKNEQLRTAFIADETGYLNVVYHSILLETKIALLDQPENIEELVNAEKHVGFDLTSPGIFRLIILPDSRNNKFSILFSYHHAILDGWSYASLRNEFLNAYLELESIKKDIQPSYGKFIGKELEAIKCTVHQQFWMDYLSDYDLKSNNLLINPLFKSASSVIVQQNFSKELNDKIINLAKKLNISPDVIFLGVYNLVVSMFYNTNDLVIGTVVNNRLEEEGGDRVFGLHLNTVPMRFRIDKARFESANDYFRETLNIKLKIDEYKLYPYGKIKSDLRLQEDIYTCAFNYMHFHITEENAGNKSYTEEHKAAKTNIPLILNVNRTKDEFGLLLVGANHFIDVDTGERLISSMLLYLNEITNNPDKKIMDYQLVSENEYQQIVHEWNNTDKNYPNDSLTDICQHGIDNYANNIAVIDPTGAYTYQQIGAYSYNIAGYLHDYCLSQKNCLIGVLSKKGFQQVVGTVGIMRAGAAYLPLHIEWPSKRIGSVLDEGSVKIVLVSKSDFEKSVKNTEIEHNYKWLMIEELINYHPKISQLQLPKPHIDDIAYVIFTSGSTGNPKGVTISHKGAVNTIKAVNEKFKISASDKVLALSELSFDLSVYDFFGILEMGGTIIFPDQNKSKEPSHWYELLKQHNITIWNTVPQLMQLLVDYAIDSNQNLQSLRLILMSGDWIPLKLPESIKLLNPESTVMSLGGATEGSIWSIWYEVKKVKAEWTSIPYGLAMPNQKMYILSDNNKHCPCGVLGNIYIGGVGVAIGYWKDEKRTKERFIYHSELGRLYHTGDQGKWNQQGYIEFGGRNDDQVKIRGYRIELGEIESVLSQIEGIKQNCVLVKERETPNGKINYLVAYYVLDNNVATINTKIIQDKLQQLLPDYMVPSAFVLMDSFPLTVNGKLDKRAMTDLDFNTFMEEYVAPSNDLEKKLCEIWQALLGLEKVGITNDFFMIGGNSIMAIQVSHKMNKILKTPIKVSDVFKFKSIQALLENIPQQKITEERIKLVF